MKRKTAPRVSLVVALDQATTPSQFAAVRNLKNWTKRLALFGQQADGDLELVYMRGFQAGYKQCMKDGRKRNAGKALLPGRGESSKDN